MSFKPQIKKLDFYETGGSGDMSKSTYDTDNDGVVDNAELLQGQNSAYHLARTNHSGEQSISTVTGLQTALDGKVNDTGDETIAGVKTFSSDPIIPDEAYGVGWNGVLEPATKNAIYDKIETLGSGGQSTYDAIVAPSGGDYTTLGAAITAASAGWSIFVKEGTYTESAITTALNNLTIVGENPATAILSHSTNNLIFSGTGVQIKNLGFSQSTGNLRLTGNDSLLENCRIDATSVGSTNANLYATGLRAVVNKLRLFNTSTSSYSTSVVLITGASSRLSNSHISGPVKSSTNSQALVAMTGQYALVANCKIESISNTTDCFGLWLEGGDGRIDNCVFSGFADNFSVYMDGGYSSVNNCHMASGKVRLNNTGCSATGNTIRHTSASSNALVFGGNYCRATGNSIIGATSASSVGITSSTNFIDFGLISGNVITGYATGITIPASTNDEWVITGNQLNGNTSAISDTGTGTVNSGNAT